MDLEEFKRDRDEALLSLDKAKIEAYLRKYDAPIAPDDNVFWASVHKARTGLNSLPEEERRKSEEWLSERGLSHWGDRK